MKKFYSIMCVGLLGGLFAFTSCSEEEFVNETPGGDEEALTDYVVKASIKQAEVLGRANMQGDLYAWNAKDVFTLWNRNKGKGYNFTIDVGYDGSQPAAVADFSGKAFWEEGHKVIAVYPAKEVSSFADFATISMPDTCKQVTSAAALTEHTYMVASGDVKNGKVPTLEFSPLTALVQFKLHSISDKELRVRYITIESDEAVFPANLKVEEDGRVSALEGMRNHLTVDMGDMVLPKGGEVSAYLNVLPTAFGDTRLIGANTLLTITAKIWNGTAEQDLTLLKAVPAKDLIMEGGVDEDAVDHTGEGLDETAYQFLAGKHYKFNLNVDYRFYVPKEGFLVNEAAKEISIYNVKGLLNWKEKVADYPMFNVKLELPTDGSVAGSEVFTKKEIDFSTVSKAVAGANWETIDALTGTFDGNGFIFKNLVIKGTGLFDQNNGEIKDLTLDGVSFVELNKSAGALVAVNSGVLLNCHVKNVKMEGINGGYPCGFGCLVGENGGEITNCTVVDGILTAPNNVSPNGIAGLAGVAKNGSSILHSSIEKVNITLTNANPQRVPNVGGFVGWQDRGTIQACYVAELSLKATKFVALGGFIGSNAAGHVRSSYVSGSLEATDENGQSGNYHFGGFVGFSNGGKEVGCYTTITFTENSGTHQGTRGGFIGKQGGSAEACYFVDNKFAGESAGIIHVANALDLQDAVTLRSINLALERADANLKYNFKVNTDVSTKEKQPLILQEAVRVPGSEGPDYGDGGDIM